jgi:tRNA(Ile)-lysidine synthase
VIELLGHLENNIRSRRLLPRGQTVVVAVSGGLDSMVLLHLLHALAPQNRWRLTVAHFNHQLRGRSSDADERLVRMVARSLGLPFVAGRGCVQLCARRMGQSVEMAARDLRHAFLAGTARKLKSRRIALAHHADDQVELFMLRLLRGAGGEGLAGMKWQSPSPVDARVALVRPLLDFRRTELAAFARRCTIVFREDQSNASLDHDRNWVRHELLPRLAARYPSGTTKTILRSMEIIGAEAEFVAVAARDWLSARRRGAFDSLPLAVQRRSLQLQLQRLKVTPDFVTVEWLRQRSDCPISLGPGVAVCRGPDGWVRRLSPRALEFRRDECRLVLGTKSGEVTFSGLRCQWRLTEGGLPARNPRGMSGESFDADLVGDVITLRHWRPGDRFQPIGMAASVKLQDWFINQKIPAERRRELVVAASAEGAVFWVEGLRISERFKLTEATRRRLIWRWQRA